MNWAVAQGHREDNPAGDAISAALPNNRVPPKHQRALPHAEVGAALETVRGSGAYLGTKLAFEFLVLTASRSGEVRQARWEEVDRDRTVWTIPRERMKTGREHRVPLSPRALEVLDAASGLSDADGLAFPSPTGRVLNHSTMTKLLADLGIDAVAHGSGPASAIGPPSAPTRLARSANWPLRMSTVIAWRPATAVPTCSKNAGT